MAGSSAASLCATDDGLGFEEKSSEGALALLPPPTRAPSSSEGGALPALPALPADAREAMRGGGEVITPDEAAPLGEEAKEEEAACRGVGGRTLLPPLWLPLAAVAGTRRTAAGCFCIDDGGRRLGGGGGGSADAAAAGEVVVVVVFVTPPPLADAAPAPTLAVATFACSFALTRI